MLQRFCLTHLGSLNTGDFICSAKKCVDLIDLVSYRSTPSKKGFSPLFKPKYLPLDKVCFVLKICNL